MSHVALRFSARDTAPNGWWDEPLLLARCKKFGLFHSKHTVMLGETATRIVCAAYVNPTDQRDCRVVLAAQGIDDVGSLVNRSQHELFKSGVHAALMHVAQHFAAVGRQRACWRSTDVA